MRTEVIFKDFKRTAATETFIEDKIEDLLTPFLSEHDRYNLKVYVGEDAHRNEQRKPHFECTATLKLDGNPKIFKVTKQEADFYEVVHETILAIQKMLRKQHDIEVSHKVHRLDFTDRAV